MGSSLPGFLVKSEILGADRPKAVARVRSARKRAKCLTGTGSGAVAGSIQTRSASRVRSDPAMRAAYGAGRIEIATLISVSVSALLAVGWGIRQTSAVDGASGLPKSTRPLASVPASSVR